jgi:hypothetical protein
MANNLLPTSTEERKLGGEIEAPKTKSPFANSKPVVCTILF